MAKRPGRLHRKLSPTGTPLFYMTTTGGNFNDNSIYSVTITRGEDSAQPRATPSTMEVTVPGAIPSLRNSAVMLQLQQSFANKVATYSPTVTASTILRRFTGRFGSSKVEDVAYKSGVVENFTSTIICSSWSSLLNVAKRSNTAAKDYRTGSVLLTAISHPSLTSVIPGSYGDLADFDFVAVSDPQLTYSAAISKYGTDIGTLVSHWRAGTMRFDPIRRRVALLTSRVETEWPILRSQGISPATWEQPIENANKQYTIERRTADGTPYTQVWPLPSGSSPVLLEEETVDWLHIRPVTNNFNYYMDAINKESNLPRTELQSLTIDLAHLLSSPKPYDQRIGAQLLALEAGDPIYLSGDWPQAIRTPYFANQIKETITPDGWEMTLSLYHPRDVLGLADAQIPTVPPRVWDSALTTWNTSPGTWNSY